MRSVILFTLLLAVLVTSQLPAIELSSSFEFTFTSSRSVAVNGDIVYMFDMHDLVINTMYGDSLVVVPLDIGSSNYFSVVDYVFTTEGDLIWAQVNDAGKGDYWVFVFYYGSTTGSLEILLEIDGYYPDYMSLDVGENVGFIQVEGELYSIDLHSRDVNGPFIGNWTNSVYSRVSAYTSDGVDYGLFVSEDRFEPIMRFIVIDLDGIVTTLDMRNDIFTFFDFNSQVYENWFILKTRYNLQVDKRGGSNSKISFINLSDITNPVETVEDIPCNIVVHSSWAFEGTMYIVCPFQLQFMNMETLQWGNGTVEIEESPNISPPRKGDIYLVGGAYDIVYFVKDRAVSEATGIGYPSAASGKIPLVIFYNELGNITGINIDGSISFSFPLQGELETNGYWDVLFDDRTNRILMPSMLGDAMYSQFLFSTCDTGSGFFGPECRLRSDPCVYGTLSDGIEGDGSCTCFENVEGNSCDSCVAGTYGAEGPCSFVCECSAEECDDGIDGTGCVVHTTSSDIEDLGNVDTESLDVTTPSTASEITADTLRVSGTSLRVTGSVLVRESLVITGPSTITIEGDFTLTPLTQVSIDDPESTSITVNGCMNFDGEIEILNLPETVERALISYNCHTGEFASIKTPTCDNAQANYQQGFLILFNHVCESNGLILLQSLTMILIFLLQ